MFVPLYIIFSLAVAFLGRHRRIGWLGFFLVSLLLTPIITLLILVLSGDRRVNLESS